MKRTFFLISVLLVNLLQTNSQNIDVDYQDYELGVDCLQQNNFELADSLITKYLNQRNPLLLFLNAFPNSTPLNDVYYNLSIAKLGLGDSASFCSYMHNASLFNDPDAFNFYCELCVNRIDTFYFDNEYKTSNNRNYSYLVVNYFDKIQEKELGRVLNMKIKPDTNHNIQAVSLGNIIGLYRVEQPDTIYYQLTSFNNLPKFRKWNKDYYSFIESKLIFPEEKDFAYRKYKTDQLTVYFKILIDKQGQLINYEFMDSNPDNLDVKYIDEAKRVLQEATKYIVPGNMLGKNVQAEMTAPIHFKLRNY